MLMERFDEWVTDRRLRRTEVEAHLERVRSDELYLGEYRCMPTGGTTGRKGIFVYDRDEWRRCLAAFLRWSELTGVRPRLGRRMRIATVGATSPLHMTARFAMSIDLGVYALSQFDARTPLCEIVAALNEHRPEQLVAYPSMASLLAREQLEGEQRGHRRVRHELLGAVLVERSDDLAKRRAGIELTKGVDAQVDAHGEARRHVQRARGSDRGDP